MTTSSRESSVSGGTPPAEPESSSAPRHLRLAGEIPIGANAAPTHALVTTFVVLTGIAAVVVGSIRFGPEMVLAGVVVAAGAAALLWRTRIATLLFFFLFYDNVLVVASQFHGVPTALASAAVLLLALPLAKSLLFDRRQLVITPTLPFVLLFLTSLCLSAALATDSVSAAGQITPFVAEGLVLYLLVSNVANTVDTVRAITRVLVAGAVAMASLSIYQELTQSYGNSFFGFAQVSDGGFNVGTDADKLLRSRLAGPIGEQNRYAQVLLIVVPLAYFSGRAAATRLGRLAGSVSAIIITAGVLLTFSRGAAVAGAVLLLLLLLHRFIWVGRLVVIVLGLAATMYLVAPDFAMRLASLRDATQATDGAAGDADAAARGRTAQSLAAWNVFVDHPVAGVGPGRFFREYSQSATNELGIRTVDTNRRAHNLYLELAADQGLVGLTAFGGLVGTTMFGLLRARRRWRDVDRSREMLAGGYLFSMYAYLLTAAFLQLSYQRYFWALLALANGAIWSLRSTDGEPADADRGSPNDLVRLPLDRSPDRSPDRFLDRRLTH